MASYLDEWHKQQKALKDKERQNKQGAAGLLHSYHGGEHDIQHEKMLTEIKKKHLQRRISATTKLQSYRGVSTPTRGQVEASRTPSSKIESVPEGLPTTSAVDDGTPIRSVTDAIAAAELHGKENDQDRKMPASSSAKKEPEKNNEPTDKEQKVSTGDDEDQSPTEAAEKEEDIHQEEEEEPDEGTRVELDFTFGLFHPKTEPAPSAPTCELAAADIVPNSIRQPKGRIISYNSEFPPVVKKIVVDEKFVPSESQQKLVRYIVRGKIPVFVKDKRKEEEEEDNVRCVQSRKSITVVGKDKKSQWKRVRKGKAYDWDKVPDKVQEGEDAPGLTKEKEESTSSSD